MKRAAATLLVGGILAMAGGGLASAAGDYPPNPTRGAVPPANPTSVEVSPEAPAPEVVDELPPTGSDGTMPTVVIAGGLLGAGALLFGASRRRRAGEHAAELTRV